MEPFAVALAELVRSGHDQLMRLTRRLVEDKGPELSDRDLEQLVNGFEALLLEALEERGTQTRDLFLETAVASVISERLRTLEQLVGGIAAFAVLHSATLVINLPDHQREDATSWLAHFYGDYAELAARTAREVGA